MLPSSLTYWTPCSLARRSFGSSFSVSRDIQVLRVAEERVAVERDLGVERHDFAIRRDDQRVDLDERRVLLIPDLVESRPTRRPRPRARPHRRRPRWRSAAPPRGERPCSGSTWWRTSFSGFSSAICLDLNAALRAEASPAAAWRSGRAAPRRSTRWRCRRRARPRACGRCGRGCPGRGFCSACSRASSALFAILTPPAFPRPPISTCALTTTGSRSARAAETASSTVVTGSPSGRRARGGRTAACLDTRGGPCGAGL